MNASSGLSGVCLADTVGVLACASVPYPEPKNLGGGNSSSTSRHLLLGGTACSGEGDFRRGIGETIAVAAVQDEALEVSELTRKPDPFGKRTWPLFSTELAQSAGPQGARRLLRVVGDRPSTTLGRAWWRGPKITLSVPQSTGRAVPALEPPASWKQPPRTP